MSTEPAPVRDFLAATNPFKKLPPAALTELADAVSTRAVKAGERLIEPGAENRHLYIIRNGAVELLDADGEFLSRLDEGSVFGQQTLALEDPTAIGATALERGLLYLVPAELLQRLCQDYPDFRREAMPDSGRRLREAIHAQTHGNSGATTLMTTPLREVARRAPVTVPPEATIRHAAEVMTAESVSALLVVEDGRPLGIVTDRDLRRRVLATGLDSDTPVDTVMTHSPTTIANSSYAYQALLVMARDDIHHLPVMDGEQVCGMITNTDLLKYQSASPFYILGDVYHCETPAALVRAGQRLAPLLVSLVQANASARSIGHVVSEVGGAINTRLLTLAERELGPPPVPYAWLVGGSLGRHEQSARSDQDNCLLLSDDYDEQLHGEYFSAFARFVCDALDACGYEYCPGEVMAVTPRWRQPLATWMSYFDAWIETPEPKALMHASIFFDLRCLGGDSSLFRSLQTYVVEKARRNRMFHAHMAANALHYQPPLGFFRNFVLARNGERDRTLDLKHRGVVPITGIARVYALAGGVQQVNTDERLVAVAGLGLLSNAGHADLRDAFEFISVVRLRHQVRQLQEGQTPDNYLSPSELSPFERNHLKDAFSVVRTIQSVFEQRYQTGILG